jgi:hypothetical protein
MTAAKRKLYLIAAKPERPPCVNPMQRGYHAVYRGDGTDRCPGCGRNQWWVRNLTATCAFCETALMREQP